jgi:hypothetical protein
MLYARHGGELLGTAAVRPDGEDHGVLVKNVL